MKTFKIYTMGNKGMKVEKIIAADKAEALSMVAHKVVVKAFQISEAGAVIG